MRNDMRKFIIAERLARAIAETEAACDAIDDAMERNGLMMGVMGHRSLLAKYARGAQPDAAADHSEVIDP